MRPKKEPKHISEMLNSRQQQAIDNAVVGSYQLLCQVCLECLKAEIKSLSTIEMGVPEWGRKTAAHYQRLRAYLEGHFIDDAFHEVYQRVKKEVIDNG